MNKTAIVVTVVSIVLAVTLSVEGAKNRKMPTPKEQLIPLPVELQKVFNGFSSLFRKPLSKEEMKTIDRRLSEYVLPSAFRIVMSGYQKHSQQEINVPFLITHTGWEKVWHIEKLNNESFHIETANTNLIFFGVLNIIGMTFG